MPNPSINEYFRRRRAGYDSQQAANAIGADGETAQQLETLGASAHSRWQEHQVTVMGALFPGGGAEWTDSAALEEARRVEPEAAQQVKVDREAKKAFWQTALVDPLMAGINVISVPQQAIYRLIAGDDVRKAIPTVLLPKKIEEAWQDEDAGHEFMFFGDLVDKWTNGGHDAYLKELSDSGGFKKWGIGGAIKVGEFAVDVFADPMTYVPFLGWGKKVVEAGRRALPKAVQLEKLIARNAVSESLTGYKASIETSEAMIKDLDDLIEAGVDVAENTTKRDSLRRVLLNEKENLRDFTDTGDLASQVPLLRRRTLAHEALARDPNNKVLQDAARMADEAVKDLETPLVSFAHMSDEALAMQFGVSADDAQMAGEALRRVLFFGDPDAAVVRNVLDDVAPAINSGELRLPGVGLRGEITRELAESNAVADLVKVTRMQLQNRRDVLAAARDALANLATDPTNAEYRKLLEDLPHILGKQGDDMAEELLGRLRAKAGMEADKPLRTTGVKRLAKKTGDLTREAAEKAEEEQARKIITLHTSKVGLAQHANQPQSLAHKVQTAAGPNVLNQVIGDTGDLLRIMAHPSNLGTTAGFRVMKQKVGGLVAALERAGETAGSKTFLQEVEENLLAHAAKTGAKPGVARGGLTKAMNAFAKGYSRIPVYNRAQWLSREAAIALGNKDIKTAVKHLKELDGILAKGGDNWAQEARRIDPKYAKMSGMSKKELKDLTKKVVPEKPEFPKSKVPANIERDLADLDARLKAIDEAVASRRSTGEWSKELLAPLGINLPFGPRRTMFNSAEYLSGRFGDQWGRMWGSALYPGSFFPKPSRLFNSYMVREPLRVLQEKVPGAWEFMRGTTMKADAERNYLHGTLVSIFEKYGIYEKRLGDFATKQIEAHVTRTPGMKILRSVNKANDTALAALLNVSRHTSEMHYLMRRMGLRVGAEVDGKVLAARLSNLDLQDKRIVKMLKAKGIDPEDTQAAQKLYEAVSGVSDEWLDTLAAHGLKEGDNVVLAHDEVRKVLDEMADKLGLPLEGEGAYINGYISHLVSPGSMRHGAYDPAFMGMHPRQVKALPFFLRGRTGDAEVVLGASELLDIYVRGAVNNLYTAPMLNHVETLIAKTNDPHLIRWGQLMLDNMRGKPTMVGQIVDSLLDGHGIGVNAARRFATTIGLLTYSAALTGNPRYPIMSLLQNFNTTAAAFGSMETLRAVAQMSLPKNRLIARMAGLDQKYKQIFEDGLNQWSELAVNARFFGLPSISDTEFAIRGITFHASLSHQLKTLGFKTLDDVVDEGYRRNLIAQAVADSESINHVFGRMGKPVWMGRASQSGSALATQFLSFPFKQTETIARETSKNPGFLFDYLLMSGQMSYTAYKANTDITDYTGVGYVKDMVAFRSEKQTLPIQAIDKTLKYFSTGLDINALPSQQDKAKEEMVEALNSLIPMSVAYNHMQNVAEALTQGVDRTAVPLLKEPFSLKGDLIRPINLGLTDDARGHGNEILNVLTGVKSLQRKEEEGRRKAVIRAKDEQKLARTRIARKIEELFDPYSKRIARPAELHALQIELNKQLRAMGIPNFVSSETVAKMVKDKRVRYNVIAAMRDYDTDKPSWAAGQLYLEDN